MDWNTIIDQLGGGLSSAVIAGLAWAWWRERNRTEALTDRLIEQSNDHAKDAVRREQDVLSTLQRLEQTIRERSL